MPTLACQNGHRVTDEYATRCPDCGTAVQTRAATPSPYRPDLDSPAPARLLVGSLALAAGAGLVFMLTAGANFAFAVILAGLIGFAAVTLWAVACVAFGVRVGLASDD